RVTVTPFTISEGHPSLATIVHVLRDPAAPRSALEEELSDATGSAASSSKGRPARRAGRIDALTDREQEILRRLARGMPTDAIAAELFFSPVTVRTRVARILGRLEVHTKLAAVAFAYQNRLVGSGMADLPALPAAGEAAKRETPVRPIRRRSVRRAVPR